MKNHINTSFSLVHTLLYVPILLLLFTTTFIQHSYAQVPATQWQKRYGQVSEDFLKTVCQTKDGGYLAVGSTALPTVTFNYDYWLVKTDSLGNVQWQKNYGGTGYDYAISVAPTADGGYILAGDAMSNNGDVTGNHGNDDVWVLKLDASGNIVWKRCYGGSDADHCSKIIQLTDGSYMVAGATNSVNGDLTGIAGPFITWSLADAWLFRLDAQGNIIWQKTYGGSLFDMASDIKELPGNEFIIAGSTSSNNGDVSGSHGLSDIWVFRINATGNIVWQKCFGGTNNDAANKMIQTQDGNFAIIGNTMSADGDVTGFHGGINDTWVIKIDGTGNLLWQRALGGSGVDWGESITQQADGTLVTASDSRSADGDVSHPLGSDDIWLAALSNNNGNLIWEQSYGGSSEDGYSDDKGLGIDIITTGDNGLAFAGLTASPEVLGGFNGSWDGYLVKLHSPHCDTLTAVHDTGVCAAHPFTLQLQVSTAAAYMWSDGTQTMSLYVHDTGIFWCSGITGCSQQVDTFHVYHAISNSTSLTDTLVCHNAALTLSADPGFDNYIWNTGSAAQQLQATDSGVYYCIATDVCRKLTDTFVVHYKQPLPKLDLGPDKELCSDTDPQVGVSYPGVQYLWNTGDTGFSIHPASSGTYTVIISNGCETAADSVFVKITDCNDCLFIPTAFSPNNDGRNDELGAIAKCDISSFQMKIYDRWGQLVFITYNINTKWDGRYKGIPLPVGTYYYATVCRAPDGRTLNGKGDITLIR